MTMPTPSLPDEAIPVYVPVRTDDGRDLRVRPLEATFYARDTAVVARELVGKLLVFGDLAGRIVETEAYLGGHDPASHAAPGPTARNQVMFGPPGRAYVYFIYGMYHCLNAVAHNGAQAGAVLFRAVEPLRGLALMHSRRPTARRQIDLASGPGKLTRAFAIGPEHNGACLTGGAVWIGDPLCAATPSLLVSPRVGIRKAADLPLRFFEANSPFVSATPLNRDALPLPSE
jgi:DNA-3-methyladenine glycosylase